MANETITVTQSLDQVTVVSEGPVGLNAGGTIEGALNVKGNLTVGVDGTGHDVKFFGDTAGKYMQWDQSADKLFINGELEVNGSATTFNSTVVTIDDPIFSLGGQQRTDALDDSKDRGLEFFYHDGAQKTGFMGYDDSADAFTFLTSATNSNEVFSGTAATVQMGNLNFVEGSGGQIQFNGTEKINIGTNNIGLRKPIYGMVSTIDIGLSSNPFRDGHFSGTVNLAETHFGSSDMRIRNSSNRMIFSTGGSDVVTIGSSGNLGVGTVSPSALLSVGGGGAARAGNTDFVISDNTPQIELRDSAKSGIISFDDNSGFRLFSNFNSNVSPQFVLQTDGKVGIGTTAPSELLHLSSATSHKPVLLVENTNADSSGAFLRLFKNTASAGVNDNIGAIQFQSNNNQGSGRVFAQIASRIHDPVAATATGELKFNTFVNGTDTTVMTMLDGNVGIGGVTAPSQKLEVGGEILSDGLRLNLSSTSQRALTSTGTNSIQIGDAGVERLRFKNAAGTSLDIDSSGRVGIGVAAPARKFHVNAGSDNEAARIESTDTEVALELKDSTGTATIKSRGDFRFNGSSGEICRMESGGNLGIGVTAPATKLDVADKIRVAENSNVAFYGADFVRLFVNQSYSFTDSGGTVKAKIGLAGDSFFNGGNVGINNSNPTAAKLVVRKDDGFAFRTENASGYTFRIAGDTGNTQVAGNLEISPTEPTINLNRNNGSYSWKIVNGAGGGNFPTSTFNIANNAGNPVITAIDSGKVGIGTTAPTKILSVKSSGADDGISLIKSDSSSLIASLTQTGTGDGAFVAKNASDATALLLRAQGNSYFNGGSVGIGTTTPSQKLEVAGNIRTSGNNSSISITDNGSDAQRLLLSNNSGTSTANSIGGDLKFEVNSTERLRLESGGLVRVFGDLQVDGTTTTVNSTTVTVDDPVLTLGGDTAPSSDDNKDRGIEFRYFDGSAKVGFMGWDDSAGGFTFLKSATNSSEVFSGTPARIVTGSISAGGNVTLLDNQIERCSAILGSSATGDLSLKDGTGAEFLRLDGGEDQTKASKHIRFNDDVQARFGTHTDASIRHDDSDFFLQNSKGDFFIQNLADGRDILLRSDDGSGGQTAYITIDGSAELTKFFKGTKHLDSVVGAYGDSSDLLISHTGSLSRIQNSTGHFEIINSADDKDIIFKSDDGSGGTVEYFSLDGSAVNTTFNKDVKFKDDLMLGVGDGSDLRLKHNGTDSFIQNLTGNFYIQTFADDKDIIFQSDDGSGGVASYITIDGSAVLTKFDKPTQHNDAITAKFGSDGDYTIQHDGSNAYHINGTGNLEIIQNADDKDIIFRCDDGSGSNTPYLTLDGSNTNISVAKTMVFADDIKASFGAAEDLRIQHNGSNTFIENFTGHLNIINYADDKDINFMSDDGSGGVETYFFLDGSASSGNPHTTFPDNSFLNLGDSRDLQMSHNGTDSVIANKVGDFYIQNAADDKDIIFQSDDGSGGVADYIKIDGSNTITQFLQNTFHPDNIQARFGSSNDLRLHHNGTSSFVENMTGNLHILNNADDGDIIFQSDDGSGGVATYFMLDGSQGQSKFNKDTVFLDSIKAKFGDGADLQIQHAANDSYIENTKGHLYLNNHEAGKHVFLRNHDGSGVATYLTLSGSLGFTLAGKPIRFPDNVIAGFGDSSDFQIQHKNSDAYLDNVTGNLRITTYEADRDIIFSADNGAGGTTPYMTLDGSAESVVFNKTVQIIGNLQVDGTTQTINSTVVTIDDPILTLGGDTAPSSDDNKDRGIEFRYYDGSAKVGFMGWDDSTAQFRFFKDATNSSEVFSGTDGDLRINDLDLYGDIDLQRDKAITFYGDSSLRHSIQSRGIDGSTADDLRINSYGSLLINLDANNNNNAGADFIIGRHGEGTAAISSTLFKVDGETGSVAITSGVEDGSALINTFNANVATPAEQFFVGNNLADVDLGNKRGDLKLFSGSSEFLRLDSSADSISFSKKSVRPDSVPSFWGTGEDLRVQHSGSSGSIYNITGDLHLINDATDGDIVLSSDDGSSGTTPYMTLDGGNTRTNIHKDLQFTDNIKSKFGTSGDLEIFHDGTNSYVENKSAGGDLYIKNTADDKDIIFQSDDGSGGLADYIKIDGGQTITQFLQHIFLPDNIQARFGSSNDLQIKHDGAVSLIDNYTGNLHIRNYSDDGDITFRNDDGSGGDTQYFRLDGGLGYNVASKHIKYNDTVAAMFGDSLDLHISHDSANSLIHHIGTGDLILKQDRTDGDIIFQSDDGSGGTTEYFKLDGANTRTTFSKNLKLEDSVYLLVGHGHDLQLLHNGTDSFIQNVTGNLKIRNNTDDGDIIFQSDDGSGGTADYITIDGSDTLVRFNQLAKFVDSVKCTFGNAQDLQIFHNGTNSAITNSTGHLTIKNEANDKDIIFQSDDGSGGVETYFFLDGSASSGSPQTVFPDNAYAAFGTGLDLHIHHNGTNSVIQNEVGALQIVNRANDQDIIFQSDDGSGGLATYLTIDGSEEEVVFSKKIRSGVVIQSPSSSITPTNNGELVVEATTNSKITFKLKGTDGVVRSAIITLS